MNNCDGQKCFGQKRVEQKCVGQKCVGQKCIGQNYVGQKCVGQNCGRQTCVGQKCVGQKCVGQKCVDLFGFWLGFGGIDELRGGEPKKDKVVNGAKLRTVRIRHLEDSKMGKGLWRKWREMEMVKRKREKEEMNK